MLQRFPYILLFLSVIAFPPASAQDARVSQYQSTPLLINPAQTGDFEGDMRVMALFSQVKSDSAKNLLVNFSIDKSFGKDDRWAIGLNCMRTGYSDFAISGKYAGVSVARTFRLDKEDHNSLRIGIQASWFWGEVDETKGTYDRNLDVNAFKYAVKNGSYKGKTDYFNLSAGVKYRYTNDVIRFETGIGAYNISHPNYSIMTGKEATKRYRVAVSSLFQYRLNQGNAIRLEQLSWKEGLFLRAYAAADDDALDLHDYICSATWRRYRNQSVLATGLFSRSWKTAGATASYAFSQSWNLGVSYELPLYKKYYDVSHLEISATFQPFRNRP